MKGLPVIALLALLSLCVTATAAEPGDQLQQLNTEVEVLKAQVAKLQQDLAAQDASASGRSGKLDEIIAEMSVADKSEMNPSLLGKFESLTLDGQIRLRWEAWNELDFDRKSASDNAFTLSRVRLGLGVKLDDVLSAYIQLQDSRTFGEEMWLSGPPFDPTESRTLNVDLHQGYIDWQHYAETRVRLGRQEVSLGEERIIGADDWHNVGRSLDGVRVTYKPGQIEDLALDLIAVKVREPFAGPGGPPPGGAPVTTLHADQDLVGVHVSYAGMLDNTIDGYVLFLNDTWSAMYPGNDPARFVTVGSRLDGKTAYLEYGAELAFQNGDWGTDNLDGWAYRADVACNLEDVTCKPRFGAEYNWAGGDHNPNDGHMDTFVPLLPSSQLYGQMDMVGWSNTSNFGLNASLKPVAGWEVKAAYWNFKLEDRQDAAYDAWGLPWGGGSRVPNGHAGTSKRLGSEWDLTVKYAYSDALSLGGGYSRFVPGKALDDAGVDDDTDFFYVQAALNF